VYFFINFYRIRRNIAQQLEPHNNNLSTQKQFQEYSNFVHTTQAEKMVHEPCEENFNMKQPEAPCSGAQPRRKPIIEESFMIKQKEQSPCFC